MDFREALNCAIKKQKFLIQHKIDDTCDEEAENDGGEESVNSNCSKNDSKRDCDGWDKPLDVWGEITAVMKSRGLTLKHK